MRLSYSFIEDDHCNLDKETCVRSLVRQLPVFPSSSQRVRPLFQEVFRIEERHHQISKKVSARLGYGKETASALQPGF